MPRHPHVLIIQPGETRGYTSPAQARVRFQVPDRTRQAHARKLRDDLARAEAEAEALAEQAGHTIENVCLELLGEEGFDLKLESLDSTRGFELRSIRKVDGRMHATVFVPKGMMAAFVRKIEAYRTENTTGRVPRPKNQDLVAGIAEIRLAVLRSFWTDDEALYPEREDQSIWWEVWIQRKPDDEPDEVFAAVVAAVGDAPLRLCTRVLGFSERLVFTAYGPPTAWTGCFVPLLDRLAELRRAKELPTDYLHLTPVEQRQFIDDLVTRITPPGAEAPAVCLLDFGVHAGHPLLRAVLADVDTHAVNPEWERVDPTQVHGTEMAGLITYGPDLQALLGGRGTLTLGHRLESVRILRTGHPHPEEAWGSVTQEGLSRAETGAPRRARVACLPVTANDQGRDRGLPSSWSAALDEHAAGQLDEQRRLYVVSAGNIRDVIGNDTFDYPQTNLENSGIEDPGQSWNALTVGAMTERIEIRDEAFDGFQPVAPRGGLCPASRTSCSWDDRTVPLKPDLVMEGGNYARSPAGQVDGCNDLSLLTTGMEPTGRLLSLIHDTSAATALAARAAATLMADYPALWPETIRGLLVHASDWTPEMLRQIPGQSLDNRQRRLRCFGYGVPDLERARYTVENCVSLIHQGEIQPFRLDGTTPRTNHFVLHALPWPTTVLRDMQAAGVIVRITLSYFVEPSPGRRGWGKKFRYASHGLRFAVRGPTETTENFCRRVSRQEWEENGDRPATRDPIDWAIGPRLRTRGSLYCDWWSATAADVAACGQVAVYPVTGWWLERKHLGFVERRTRYSLIITLSTNAVDVDLYTPIAQQVGLTTEIPV